LTDVLLRHDLIVHQHLQENRPGTLEMKAHPIGPDLFDTLHFLDKSPAARSDVLVQDALKGKNDVVRGESLAIVEPHSAPQVKLDRPAVYPTVLLSQLRDDLVVHVGRSARRPRHQPVI
jgi:hypothetical protein